MTAPFRLYLGTLLRGMSWKVSVAFALMVCLGLTEGIGLLMLVPLLALVGLDVEQGATGRIAQLLASAFGAVGMRPTLLPVLSVYVLIVSLHGMLARCQITVNFALENEFVALLRKRLYRAIANTNWLFFSRSRSADFTHVLTAEVERVGQATQCLLHLVVAAVVALVYTVFALRLSVVMTALAFASGAGLMLLLRGKTRVVQAAGEELSRAMNRLYAAAMEHLGGMKIAKGYAAEERHAEVFSRLTERVRQTCARTVRGGADAKYWFEVGSVLVLSVIVYVSVEVMAVPTAELLLLLFLFTRIMQRVSGLQQSYQSLLGQLPAFAAVVAMHARCEAAVEPKPQRTESIELRHAIRLERVSFRYEARPIIRDLSLSIPARKTTAVVGPSGSGKSTVIDLVIGLLGPNEGHVLVDGLPLTPERRKSWREQIGYVTQETFLFNETIRANLLWAAPGTSEEEVWRALGLAAAEEFVRKLPQGLDSVVGDRGVLLSGGERQRLALARALLRKPSLLILDEATSALDSENERRIYRAIERLHGDMTILVITHRVSTVWEADLIYVMDEGRVMESGTRDDLLGTGNGRFHALCEAQGIALHPASGRPR